MMTLRIHLVMPLLRLLLQMTTIETRRKSSTLHGHRASTRVAALEFDLIAEQKATP
jgi:hypothetical protein